MSFFTDASFVMDPNVYGVGKLYVPKPTDGSGDLTFSRASTGTRVNQDGLIEKVRTNLLLHSNQFDTTWTNVNSAETGGQAGYDGTNNAWKLENVASGGSIRQSYSASGIFSFSVYAKAGNANYIRLFFSDATGYGAWFNLSDGTVGTNDGINANITSVGSGWYRVSFSANVSSLVTVRIYPTSADAVNGNAGDYVYIQDAQFETGDIATDYIPTTTSAVSVGPLANIPRLNYGSDGCPSLLLEPQRTNDITFSESFDNAAWAFKDNVTITPNVTATLDPSGYYGADKLVEDSSNNLHRIYRSGGGSGATFSFFAKAAERSWVSVLSNNGAFSFFNIGDGTLGTIQSGSTAKITPYANGWYRCELYNTHISYGALIQLATGNNVTAYQGDGTSGAYIFGAQLEQSASYATSYIPTLSTSVTRVQDAASKTGISSLIGQTEGTIFAEFEMNTQKDHYWPIITAMGATTSDLIEIYGGPNSLYGSVIMYAGGVVQSNVGFSLTLGRHKIAIGYANNNTAVYLDGTLVGTVDTSCSVPTMTQIGVGKFTYSSSYAFGDNINQALLFKTRLSNADLARLTSL